MEIELGDSPQVVLLKREVEQLRRKVAALEYENPSLSYDLVKPQAFPAPSVSVHRSIITRAIVQWNIGELNPDGNYHVLLECENGLNVQYCVSGKRKFNNSEIANIAATLHKRVVEMLCERLKNE